MNDLGSSYLTYRQQLEDDELDRMVRSRLGLPLGPTRPVASPEQIGVAREFVRGVARGGARSVASFGTGLQAVGTVLNADTLKVAGEEFARSWSQTAEQFAPSERARGSLWDNPWLVLNPSWMASSIGETVPSLAAAMIPAAGAYGVGLRIGSRFLPYSPALVMKLARVGASVTGGAVGGFLEGASTYETVKGRGGSDDDAVKAMALMGLASAGLNAISFGTILGTGKTALGRFAKGGLTEALTEYLEEPAEAAILGDDIVQSLKQGVNVIPAALLTGGAAAAGLGGPEGAKRAEAAAGQVATERGAITLPSGEEPAKATTGEPHKINLKYLNLEPTANRAVKNLQTYLEEQGRGVKQPVTHGQTTIEAQGVTLEQALGADLDTLRGARGIQHAVAQYFAGGMDQAVDMARRAVAGDADAAQEIIPQFALVSELAEKHGGLGEAAGQLLEARKIPVMKRNVAPENVVELARYLQNNPETDGLRLARMLLALPQRQQQEVFVRNWRTLALAGKNGLYEAWVNGLLTNPQTHVVNFLSNSLTTLWAIPERALAAQFHVGTDIGVVRGESTAMLRGMMEGFMDGLIWARQAWDTGRDPIGDQGKVELREPAISAGKFGEEGTTVGRAIDMLGHGVTLPVRMLGVADAFFKGVNYRMEVKAQALRLATLEAAGEHWTAEQFARRVAQHEANPPAVVKDAAERFALLQTFTNDLGERGQTFMRWANQTPGARLILPFIRTPTNILTWTMQRTPALSLLSAQIREDLRMGGAARDLALAKMAMGAMTSATVVMLAGAGLITGGGPRDPDLRRQLRDAGWQPYSLKFGNIYVAYNRLDPIGALLGLTADSAEIIGQVPEFQSGTIAAAVALAFAKNMTNKTYLEGVSRVVDAVHDPVQYGPNWLRRFMGSLIPAGIRAVERYTDPMLRETNSILDEIKAGVPGWSATLPPRRNLFGEPILMSGGLGPDLISPIYTSTLKDDPVSQEIVRLGVDLTMPSKIIAGTRPPQFRFEPPSAREGIELTPDQYDRFVALAGREIIHPATGLNLKESLFAMMRSAEYAHASDGPDGGKAMLVRQMVSVFRDSARVRFLNDDDDLRTRVTTLREHRLLARTSDSLAPSLGR